MSTGETEQSNRRVGEDLCTRTAGKTLPRAELCQKVLEALALCPPTREGLELQLRYNVRHKRWEALSWKAMRLREVLFIFGNAVLLSAVLVAASSGIAALYGIPALPGIHAWLS
ncbi:MAG: hypothetical protein ACYDEV_00060 [Acidiferrobacter sp.]